MSRVAKLVAGSLSQEQSDALRCVATGRAVLADEEAISELIRFGMIRRTDDPRGSAFELTEYGGLIFSALD